MRMYNGTSSRHMSDSKAVLWWNKNYRKGKARLWNRFLKQSERNEVREDIKDEVATMDISDRDLGVTNVHGVRVEPHWAE